MRLGQHMAQSLRKSVTIGIISEDFPTFDSPHDDVMQATRCINSGFSWHDNPNGRIIQSCQSIYQYPSPSLDRQIIDDARSLEDSGVFSIILEAVPALLGKLVAEAVDVPVIGIGAGPEVDGQVLVTHDMVGLFDRFVPKFVKQYANIRAIILDALQAYKKDVLDATFPGPEHSFKMPAEALKQLKKMIEE